MELGQEHLASQVPDDCQGERGSSFPRHGLAVCLSFPEGIQEPRCEPGDGRSVWAFLSNPSLC